jgi:hypothetical protein
MSNDTISFGTPRDLATIGADLERGQLHMGDQGTIIIGRIEGSRVKPIMGAMLRKNGTVRVNRMMAVLYADRLARAGRLGEIARDVLTCTNPYAG